jgi:HAD superfamily hydrolase (TIGR01509 family)
MERVFRECYREFGNEGEPPLEDFFNRMGMPLPQILRDLRLPEQMSERYRELSRQLFKQIRVVPGAYSTLELLTEAGTPIGLMTGKDRERTLEILSYFDLKHFFSGIVCGDDPFAGKPSPGGLLALARKFGLPPDQTVIIGDSVVDVQCGHAAGALTAAVTWGFESRQRLVACGAHKYLSSFEELDSWILACRGYFHPDPSPVYSTGYE